MDKDFTFMWWRDGFNKGSRRMYFRTSHYGMAYDNNTGALCKFGALPAMGVDQAYNSNNAEIDSLFDINTEFCVKVNGTEQKCTHLEQIDFWGAHSRILEMGRCRCSMDAMYYRFGDLDLKGRCEFAAHPAFATVTVSGYTQSDIQLSFILKITTPFTVVSVSQSKVIFDEITVILHGCTASVQGNTLVLASKESALKKEQFDGGFSIDILPRTVSNEYIENISAVKLTAKELKSGAYLKTVKSDSGCVSIITDGITPDGYRENASGYLDFEKNEHRSYFERVLVTVENNGDTDLLLPICFYKDKDFPISGVCPVLRKVNGEPCGIYVQLSKNWHRMHSDPNRKDDVFYASPTDPRRYLEGPWLHAWCNIPVKAGQKLELEYNCLFASWGTVWSASHSQLCLAGWGGAYQLWESSAIGAFGEAFCYDAETSHGRAFIDDIRPLTVYNKNDVTGKKYQWTGCNGGGNFILCQNGQEKVALKDVRSYFRNQGPNLCQVIHTAKTCDNAVNCEFTAFLPRTDDCSRAIHSFEYTFEKDVDYSRLVLYQFGADHYNDNDYPRLCIGNDDGPIAFDLDGMHFEGEFEAPVGDTPGYIGGKQMPITVPGDGLFLACLGARMTNTNHCKYGPVANRTLVLRGFEAVVNGKKITKPAVSLYRTKDFDVNCIALELCLPEGGKVSAGSRIRGVVEYINLPIKKQYYYGTSQILRSFPDNEFDTWHLAARYNKQGRIKVNAVEGRVLRDYPTKVECVNDKAVLELSGGISYAAITFCGLSEPYGFKLLVQDENGRYYLDQSHNQSDFKQCFYGQNGWEITFNVELNGGKCTLWLEKTP